MASRYFEKDNSERILLTLNSISETIENLIEWNRGIISSEIIYKRIYRIVPDFLASNFPDIPWRDIVGMRNHIAHGYFELDADIVFEAVKNDIPDLIDTIHKAMILCKECEI